MSPRVRDTSKLDGVSKESQWAAAVQLLVNDAEELEDLLPEQKTNARRHPAYAILLSILGAEHFSNATRSDIELTDGSWWGAVGPAAERRYPGSKAMRPGDISPSRQLTDYYKRVYLTTPEARDVLNRHFMRRSTDVAKAMGLCRDDGRKPWLSPDRSRVVFGDGTHLKSASDWSANDTRTVDGEKRTRRHDPDARLLHVNRGTVEKGPAAAEQPRTGADTKKPKKEVVIGTPWTFLFTRGEDVAQVVALAFGAIPMGEAAGLPVGWHGDIGVGLTLLEDVMRHLDKDGPLFLAWDGAAHDVHCQRAMDMGLVVVSNPSSYDEDGRDGESPSPRRAAAAQFVHMELRHPNGSRRQVRVELREHCPIWVERNVDGSETIHAFRTRRVKRQGRPGAYSFSAEFAVPEAAGGGVTNWVRLDNPPEDLYLPDGKRRTTPFKRAEYLRPISPLGRPEEYRLIYGQRKTAETENRLLDDSLLRERCRSYGVARQWLDLYAHFMLGNLENLLRYQKRHGLEASDLEAA